MMPLQILAFVVGIAAFIAAIFLHWRAGRILPLAKSLRVRAGLSFVIAMSSPLVMNPLSSIDPFADYRPSGLWLFFPGLFLILSVFMILVLSLTLPWDQYNVTWAGAIQTLSAFIISLFSLWGSVWCFSNHVCMGGHGCHGMPAVDCVVDGVWIVGLIGSSAWLAFARSPITVPFTYISGFVISYRFFFGSMGGIGPYPI